ncbi:MAG TPA: hypothetical protein VFS96_08860 [Nitrolancea sp.]|nr:hypothetical protein [Nitrolancea sp.]
MAVSRLRRYRSITAILGLLIVALLVAGAASSLAAQTTPPPRPHFDSAFPDAEIIHVVSEDSSGTVTETWVDQTTGDVLKKTTDKDGTLRQVHIRHETTMSRYVVTDRSTGFYQRQVLTKDDPYLSEAVVHLDGLRWGLERGGIVNLGEEAFHGRRAIKVKIPEGSVAGTIVYLDPDTLYPLGYVDPSGAEYSITYRTIETLSRADVSGSVFQFAIPPTDFRETHQELAADDIAQFTAYPLLNLGPVFGDYTLYVIERFQSQNKGQDAEDKTYSVYHKRDMAGNIIAEIHVTVRKPLTEQERVGTDKAVRDGILNPAEPVTVNGESARLRPDKGRGMWLEIERPDAYIHLFAPDRDTVLAAGAALKPATAVSKTQ